MVDSARSWLMESFSGVNILMILTLVGGGVWYIVEGRTTQSYLIDRIASLEDKLDDIRENDIKMETMRLTVENLANYIARVDTQVATLQESGRDAHFKIRALEKVQ